MTRLPQVSESVLSAGASNTTGDLHTSMTRTERDVSHCDGFRATMECDSKVGDATRFGTKGCFFLFMQDADSGNKSPAERCLSCHACDKRHAKTSHADDNFAHKKVKSESNKRQKRQLNLPPSTAPCGLTDHATPQYLADATGRRRTAPGFREATNAVYLQCNS